MHFGLGDQPALDSVLVEWPDRTQERFEDIQAGPDRHAPAGLGKIALARIVRKVDSWPLAADSAEGRERRGALEPLPRKPALRQLGLDEIHLGKKQKFLTVVSNLETGGLS